MLQGQVVVVTGATGTIGAPLCRAIADAGAVVVVTDVDADSASRLSQELRSDGHQAVGHELDITDSESIDELINELDTDLGRIDSVVNCSYPRGPNFGRRVEELTLADFNHTTTAHLGGYFAVMQRFAPALSRHGGGSIVSLTSIYGVHAPDFRIYEGTDMTMPVDYAATKAGIVGLTKYFASYYLDRGVRFNAVAPGGIREDQPKQFVEAYTSRGGVQRMLEPQDVVGTIVFLLSSAAKHMTGQVLVVDDGWTL